MKIGLAIFAVAFLTLAETGFTQSFQNLGFESANVPSLPAGQHGGYVSITNALPGWTAYTEGTNQAFAVLQNNATLGTASLSILGPHWTNTTSLVGGIIEGNYSVVLQAGSSGLSTHLVDTSISQVGMVPTNAQSIQVKVFGLPPALTISFAGQNLPWTVLDSTASYMLFGADISGFAGQVGALTFTAPTSIIPYNTVTLDSIVFSTQQIPEPNGLALFGAGALLLSFFRRRNSSR